MPHAQAAAHTHSRRCLDYRCQGCKQSAARRFRNLTATEVTLTTHSVSGKATTYQMMKRNHPAKVQDPMMCWMDRHT
jgi:hypothetical protein